MNTAIVQIKNTNNKYKISALYGNIIMTYYNGSITATSNSNNIAFVSYQNTPYYDNAEILNNSLGNPYSIPNNPILYAAIALRKGIWETIPNCKIYGSVEHWALTQLRKVTRCLQCEFQIEYQIKN